MTIESSILTADNQVIVGQTGAIDVMLDILKKHVNNVGVCKNGYLALANIASNGK